MIFLGYGNGTFSDGMFYSTGPNSSPCSVAVSDLNNDTRLDIVVANYWAYNIGVFLGYGNGHFRIQLLFQPVMDSNPLAIAIGDFNSDYQFRYCCCQFWSR